EFRALMIKLGLAALGLIAVTAGIVFAISRDIGASLKGLRDRMASLAAGELEVTIAESGRGDEIGDMARTVQGFKDNALEMRRMQTEQDALKARGEAEKRQMMTDLADDFERRVSGIVDGLSAAAAQMQTTARSMSSTADGTRQRSLAVASAADQATANVQ